MHLDDASKFWLVTSHAACAAALADRSFSAALGQRERTREDELPASMLTSDPPDHARLRGPGALLLGPAALRRSADGIADAAARVVNGLDGKSEADVTADIGEPYAVEVFTRLLAVPPERAPGFADLARRISVNLDPLAGAAAGAAGRTAVDEFNGFMDQHIKDLEASGADCPLTSLANDSRLTRGEMLGIVSLAVVGGFLPLADLTGHAVYWVTAQGQELGSLHGQVSQAGTANLVIDELMRLATPIPFTARVTTQAVELDGFPLPAGSRVLLVIAAANRDPRVFEHPGSFDKNRSPNPHLAFGMGPHLCLGAPLVRAAGGALLRELAARYPGSHQAGTAEWDKPLVPRRLRGQRLALGESDR